MNLEEFETNYGVGNAAGKSQTQQEFGYQFAIACVDYTIQILKEEKDNKLDEAITRFGKAVLNLNSSEFGYIANYLSDKLAFTFEKFANINEKNKGLNNETKTDICKIVAKLKDFNFDKQAIFIDYIADFNNVIDLRKKIKI